jgi:hypothetical protein
VVRGACGGAGELELSFQGETYGAVDGETHSSGILPVIAGGGGCDFGRPSLGDCGWTGGGGVVEFGNARLVDCRLTGAGGGWW